MIWTFEKQRIALITLGPRLLVQVVLLITFLYFFGFPAVMRFAKKEVMVVETTKDTHGIPSPAFTIAVVNQIKNDSCFDKGASAHNAYIEQLSIAPI